MKPLLTFLVLFGTVAILADDGAIPQPEASSVGRFQIAVAYSSNFTTPNQEDRITLRIDTATGETWKLSPVPLADANGKLQGGFDMWTRVQEIGGDLHRVATQQMTKAQGSGR